MSGAGHFLGLAVTCAVCGMFMACPVGAAELASNASPPHAASSAAPRLTNTLAGAKAGLLVKAGGACVPLPQARYAGPGC